MKRTTTRLSTARESNSLATYVKKSSEDDSMGQESVSTDFFAHVAGEFYSPAGRRTVATLASRTHQVGASPVAEHSLLRRADPRTKLLVSVAASAGLMLPLPQLAAILAGYFILVTAAGLGREVVVPLRRTAVFLIVLCAVDWLCVGFDFAVLIALRLVLLVTSFTAFFATTTPDELQVALESFRVPARLAFTFATAYRFVTLFGTEWRGIVEAQRARGIVLPALGWRGWHEPRQQLTKAVGLVVPVVVLATQRAWSINEAAAARGFDSPQRSSSRRLRLTRVDHVLLTATVALWVALLACR